MRRVGSHEAKTHLPPLLYEVARGETITITKRGGPVAILKPCLRGERSPSAPGSRRPAGFVWRFLRRVGGPAWHGAGLGGWSTPRCV